MSKNANYIFPSLAMSNDINGGEGEKEQDSQDLSPSPLGEGLG